MSIQTLFTPEVLILLQVGFIGALGFFLLVSKNFTAGIYIWLLSVLFLKYQKIIFVHSIVPDLSIDRILFVFLCVIFIAEIFIKKRKIFHFTGIEYSMFLFCLFVVLSMLWTGFILKEGGRIRIGGLLTGYVFPFSMFFISRNVYDTPKKREGFIKFILLVGVYLTFTAVCEHFRLDRLVWPRYILDPQFGIHYGRARGPFVMASANGMALNFTFLACLYFLFNSYRDFAWKKLSYILLVTASIAIFFTYTRAAWLSVFLGLAILIISSRIYRKKAFLVVLIALYIGTMLGLFYFFDSRTMAFATSRVADSSPIYARMNLYAAYLNMFMHNPLFGIGFGRFSDCLREYLVNIDGLPYFGARFGIHDTFMGVLVEMGAVGMFLILFIYFSIFSRSVKLYKRLCEKEIHAERFIPIFWAVSGVYLFGSIFSRLQYFEYVNSLFFIFSGIICGWEGKSVDTKAV